MVEKSESVFLGSERQWEAREYEGQVLSRAHLV